MSPPLTKDKKTKIPLDKVNSNQKTHVIFFSVFWRFPMIFRAFKLAIFMERYTKAAVFEIREISIY